MSRPSARVSGSDRPLIEQFVIWIADVVRGDFGESFFFKKPVAELIAGRLQPTLALAICTLILAVLMAVPLGVLAAVRRGSLADQIVRVIGLIGYSVPIYWLGLLSLVFFYAQLKWVAFPGRLDIVHEYSFTPITGFYLIDAIIQRDWGASDFVLPSAGPAEVEARVRLLTQRPVVADPDAAIRVDELVVDPVSYQVRLRGRPLDLTFKEFELLRFLAARPGRVSTRAQLLQEVWGYDFFGGTRTVDVHVARLRRKLGAPYRDRIVTVRRVGYKYVP